MNYSYGESTVLVIMSFLPFIINRLLLIVLIRLTERQTKTYSFIDFLSFSVTAFGLKRIFFLFEWNQFVGFEVTTFLLRTIMLLKMYKPFSDLIYWTDTGVKRFINKVLHHEIISISDYMNKNKFHERSFENCSKRFYSSVFIDIISSFILLVYFLVFNTLTLEVCCYYLIDIAISLGVSINDHTVIRMIFS